MYLKHSIVILGLFFITKVQSQVNYISVDYSAFELKDNTSDRSSTIPNAKMMRFNGNSIGESFHLALGRYSSFGIGVAVTNINYEKQWVGIFKESNQLGAATVTGNIHYLSLPFSLSLMNTTRTLRHYCYSNRSSNPMRYGINITYVPSFQTKNSVSKTTYGSADSSSFFSDYNSNTSEFQHSLTIGLSNQFLLCNKKLKLTVEPYWGYGSSFFSKHGSTMIYGIRCQIGIHLKLPRISLEKNVKPGNYNDKKKELEQKQKEIEQQLNKPH